MCLALHGGTMWSRSWAFLIVLMLVQAADATVTRVWTSSGSNVNHLVCAGDDTLDAGACGATTSCQLGTASPAACEVGECFFDTDATAGQNLYGCTAANTWTLLGDGTGSVSPGGPDTAVQFSASGSFAGDSAFTFNSGTDTLTVPVVTNAGSGLLLDDSVSLYDSVTNVTASLPFLEVTSNYDQSGVAVNSSAISFSPTVSVGDTGASLLLSSVELLRAIYDLNVDGTSPSASLMFAAELFSFPTIATNVPSASFGSHYATHVIGAFRHTSTGTGTFTSQRTFNDEWALQSTGTGTASIGEHTSFRSAPRWEAAAGSAVQVTARRGLWVSDYSETNQFTGNGTESLTSNIGIEIDALTAGSTNIGIRNASPYVSKPSQQAPGAGFTITVDAEYVELDPASSVTSSATTAVAAGADGQRVVFSNTDSGSNTVTFQDGANLALDGDFTLNPGDTLTLIYDSTASSWLELSRGDNDSSDSGGGGGGSTVTSAQASISGSADACAISTVGTSETTAVSLGYDNSGKSTLISTTVVLGSVGSSRTFTARLYVGPTGSTSQVAESTGTMTAGEDISFTLFYLDTTSAAGRTAELKVFANGGTSNTVDGCFLTRISHN